MRSFLLDFWNLVANNCAIGLFTTFVYLLEFCYNIFVNFVVSNRVLSEYVVFWMDGICTINEDRKYCQNPHPWWCFGCRSWFSVYWWCSKLKWYLKFRTAPIWIDLKYLFTRYYNQEKDFYLAITIWTNT